jgi:hypothetical protein
LSEQIVVSFESEAVRVVHATRSHDSLVVRKAEVLSQEEFETYLKGTRDNDFVVVKSFDSLYQDLIYLPPAKDQLLKNLVRVEIKKRFPELTEFTFFHTVLRESMREGRRLKETFFYAVSNDDLNQVFDPFARNSKNVACVFSGAVSVASLVEGVTLEEDILCVLDLGRKKVLFLVRDRKVEFVRVAQSDGVGINQLDADGINTTVAHCRQALRLNPARIILIGTPPDKVDSNASIFPPPVQFTYPTDVVASEETVRDYIVPISALMHGKELESSSLVPQSYQSFAVQKRFLSVAAGIVLVLSLAGIVYCVSMLGEIGTLKSNIQKAKAEIQGMQGTLKDYQANQGEFQKYRGIVTMLNAANAAPDTQKALASLQFLPMKNVKVQSIRVSNEKGSQMDLSGSISAQNYADAEATYRDLVEKIRNTDGMEVASQKLELKSMNFSVGIKWKK